MGSSESGGVEVEFESAGVDGQRFVFSDTGKGPLVILLHGFPDTPRGWDGTRDALNAAGYRTVVPYLRGYHPDTIVPGRRYGGEEIGEDTIRLMDAIGADRAVIVGHDWGAGITYRTASIAPDRVHAICTVAIPHPMLLKPSPGLLWAARHFLTLRLPTGTRLASHNDFAYLDTLMRRWAPNWSGTERDETLADAKRCFADPRCLDGALSYYREASRDAPPKLKQPALVVCGTSDIISTEPFLRSPEAFEGPCEVLVCEGPGHWPHREAAEEFNQRLLEFLDGLRPQAAA